MGVSGPNDRFAGVTRDSIIFLTLDLSRDHFSITGTELNRFGRPGEQVEKEARDSVMDGTYDYLHAEGMDKDASLKDFREHLADDLEQNALEGDEWYGPDGLYHNWQSTGQIDMSVKPSDFVRIAGGVTHADLQFVWTSWKKYQVESLPKVPKPVVKRLERIFAKLPEEPTREEIAR